MRSFERLLAFASRWFDPATVANVFEPMLADWHREWLDATPSRRRLVMVRGSAAFAATVIASLPRVAVAPIPASLSRRIAIRVGLFCVVASAAEAGFYFWDPVRYHDAALLVPLASWPYVIPSLVTIALPFAMASGVDAIRCVDDLPGHLERRAVLKLVIVATLWMTIAGGWLVPAANQRWRAEVFSANPALDGLVLRGARELSTVELFTTKDKAFPLIRPGERMREINLRLSLVVLPWLVVWLRWRMLELPRTKWLSVLPPSVIAVSVAVCFFMMLALDGLVEETFSASPGLGLLSSLIVFGLAGLAVQKWRRRSVGYAR